MISLALQTVLASAVAASPFWRPWHHWRQSNSPTYFFTFGDSYSQTNFDVTGTQPSASDPMGNPALGTGTTGGGINWIGYLTTVDNASLVLSYNLAIGGAGIDNTIVNTTYPDMASQVATFEDVYSQKPSSAPWDCEDAVFGWWIGINDIGWAFSNPNVANLIPRLIARYEELVEKTYAAGARKFLFLNVPPTSRSPYIASRGDAVEAEHAKWLGMFNDQLASMVTRFREGHAGVTTVLYDSWSFMTQILDHPQAYGYPDATCINSDGHSCVWWNNYHPGERYHRLQAADMKQYLGPLGPW